MTCVVERMEGFQAGFVIGQHAVDGKSNEIKAIPELLEMLAITGAIGSIDAMGTQKAIAAKITAILKKDKSKLSLKRKRLKASVNPSFRMELLTC